jgi:DNA-binding CsgD family transcriptional regulator
MAGNRQGGWWWAWLSSACLAGILGGVESRSVLPGRSEELSRLGDALRSAAAGRPQVVVVEGELGAGKTRLVQAWQELVRAAGGVAAVGGCVALPAAPLPYGPIGQVLRGLRRGLGVDRFRALTAGAPAELAELLPADSRHRDRVPGRLPEALLDVLEAASADRPVAVCVEDLHWVDPATADVLRYLARSLTTQRLVLVLDYRPEEMTGRQELRAELARLAGPNRLLLPPLGLPDLRDLLGSRPDLRRLYDQSGGNPYFAAELAAGNVDSVRAVLTARVRGAGPSAVRLLRLVGVAGGSVDIGELAAAGFAPRALADALAEAVERGLLRRSGDRVEFRYPLLGDLVDAAPGCGPGEQALSARVAAVRAERLLWSGRAAEAVDVISRALAAEASAEVAIGAGAETGTGGGTDGGTDAATVMRLCAVGARAVADLAELAMFSRSAPGPAPDFAAIARRHRPRVGELAEAVADAQLVGAEADRGNPAAWLAVQQAFAVLDRPALVAYCGWRAVEALLARRDRRKAARVLAAATRIAEGPVAAELSALARRARLTLPAPAKEHSDGPLTPRERAVLVLVCEGHTNRQIGRALFISESTAGVHVSRILTKLQVPTRGAAAAAARRLGVDRARPEPGPIPIVSYADGVTQPR